MQKLKNWGENAEDAPILHPTNQVMTLGIGLKNTHPTTQYCSTLIHLSNMENNHLCRIESGSISKTT